VLAKRVELDGRGGYGFIAGRPGVGGGFLTGFLAMPKICAISRLDR
jgi:hypothetical protein